MKFIAIETITNICSISLFNSDKKIDLLETTEDFTHSKNLPLLFIILRIPITFAPITGSPQAMASRSVLGLFSYLLGIIYIFDLL